MKKKILFFACGTALLTVMICNISISKSTDDSKPNFGLSTIAQLSLASGEGSGYSCSASSDCYNWGGQKVGSVSCTGTSSCSRGSGWVKCDGKKTEC